MQCPIPQGVGLEFALKMSLLSSDTSPIVAGKYHGKIYNFFFFFFFLEREKSESYAS
jgi:hypothetical protein